MSNFLFVIRIVLLVSYSVFFLTVPVHAEAKVTLTGYLYNDELDLMGLADVGVNPFYAFWFIRCYDLEGNMYQEQLDERGCFSIDVPADGHSYCAVFLNQQKLFQAGICFPFYGKNTSRAYFAFLPGDRATIDFGRLQVTGGAAVPDQLVQQSIDISHKTSARDSDNDGIPDGYDNENDALFFAGVITYQHDLDNDGVPDNSDFDIDDDALPNELDFDIDGDGISNEDDLDNGNDGINDFIGPVPPRVAVESISDSLTGTVPIALTVTDENGDPVDLIVSYSINEGEEYKTATLLDTPVTQLVSNPLGMSHTIMWYTKANFGSADIDGVLLSITPRDAESIGDSLIIGELDIRNNHSPEVLIISPEQGHHYSGTITIEWHTEDMDTDQDLQAKGLWMTFDRENFVLLSDDIAASDTYQWDVMPLGYQPSCILAILVTDGYSDAWATSGQFVLEGKMIMQGVQILSPAQTAERFSGVVPISWESDAEMIRYDLYASHNGFDWNPIAQQITTQDWNWDIHRYPNTAGVRIMLKAQKDDDVAYRFSPVFIMKNENHTPDLTVLNPNNNAVLSGQTLISWNVTDPDPGDIVQRVSISYSSTIVPKQKQVVCLENGETDFSWDVSQLPDMSDISLHITVSDGDSQTTVTVENVSVDNPPYLLRIEQHDSETIEIVFTEDVTNLYQSISFSSGVVLRSLQRLAPAHYLLTTTACPMNATCIMTLSDSITDKTGHHMHELSLPLGGIVDTAAPELSKPPIPIDNTHIDLVFSEPVVNAETVGAYRIEPQLSVSSVIRLTDNVYRLLTLPQHADCLYTIYFEGITDLTGNTLQVEQDAIRFTGFSNIVRVDPDGNGDFINVETALQHAPDGVFIQLAAGIYNDGLRIPADTHITIQGGFDPQTWQRRDGIASVITAQDNQPAVNCGGIACLIDLQICSAATGVKIFSGNCMMYRCRVFENQKDGILAMGKSSVSVVNCAVYNNKNIGIRVYNDLTALLLNSVIYNNESHGVVMSGNAQLSIANCIVRENRYGICLEKCLDAVPVITHTCFYRNNRGQSLDASYSVMDSCSGSLYVINTLDKLEQPDKGWIANIVADPKWDAFFLLQERSPLLASGTDEYNDVYDLLPASVAPTKLESIPVGLIEQ